MKINIKKITHTKEKRKQKKKKMKMKIKRNKKKIKKRKKNKIISICTFDKKNRLAGKEKKRDI